MAASDRGVSLPQVLTTPSLQDFVSAGQRVGAWVRQATATSVETPVSELFAAVAAYRRVTYSLHACMTSARRSSRSER